MTSPNTHGLQRGIRLVGLGALRLELLLALFDAIPSYIDVGIEIDEETLEALREAELNRSGLEVLLPDPDGDRSPRRSGYVGFWRSNPVFLITKAPPTYERERKTLLPAPED